MEDYPSKSPEKSSPSFPEDAEDDDDDNGELMGFQARSPNRTMGNAHEVQNDVTMVADDDDDMEPNRPLSCAVDSPRHPADSSDKKVHWTNTNVQTLLDYVEKHLEEFNIQKKHKQVWQAIGSEMEHLGFTTEHCYNKWKNLRRDVRLLVNNPQKAVRNADILRRVARLILIIYPNVDATTMQVCSDRTGVRSTPCTPGGIGSSTGKSLPTMAHPPDSPAFYRLTNCHTPQSSTPSHHPITPNVLDLKPGLHGEAPVPRTALFTNLDPSNHPSVKLNANGSNHIATNDPGHDVHLSQPSPNEVDSTSQSQPNLPLIFNPATAALLVQSQIFNDLIRQQQRGNDSESNHTTNGHQSYPPAVSHADINIPISTILQGGSQNTTGLHAGGNLPAVSLAATLLNGLVGANAPSLNAHESINGSGNGSSGSGGGGGLSGSNSLLLNVSGLNGILGGGAGLGGGVTLGGGVNTSNASRMSIDAASCHAVHASAANLLSRLPSGNELASVVERLRDEEAVHVRLADMVAHLADELRAAGQRRQAALEQLLGLVKGRFAGGPVSTQGNDVAGSAAAVAAAAALFHGQTAAADAGGMA